MELQTDSELIARIRRGEKDAFAPLIERYQAMVRHIVAGMIAHEDCACELEQEAILQAYLSLAHLRDPARFRNWLYGITLNVCRSYIREQKINPLSLEALMGGTQGSIADFMNLFTDAIDPQVIAEERELHQIVLRTINVLSAKERAVTLMFYYEQLSQEEIAAILNISVPAVKGRLHRARQQLRERLASTYAELAGKVPVKTVETAQRNRGMIKVTIGSVRKNLSTKQKVVILQDEAVRKVLFIWIQPLEAWAIAAALTDVAPPRPLAIHLMADMMKATGIQLQEVRIEALKENIFYATIKTEQGGKTQEIDARPSDALILATLFKSPIYVAEEVMNTAGMTLPEGRKFKRYAAGDASKEATQQRIRDLLHEIYPLNLPKIPLSAEESAAALQKLVEVMTEEE